MKDERLNNVKYIFYDFDGVMTDNRVLVDENGTESVFVNRSDGLAVSKLRKNGFFQAIISTESNSVVEKRANKLQIPVFHNVDDKGEFIRNYITENKIDRSQTAFVGNDINDISAYQEVAVKICPSDAYEEILDMADIVMESKGGHGVIRELMNLLI